MHEPSNQRREVEPAVDAVLGLGQVALAILVEIEMMVGAVDRRLDVGDKGIDPAERLQVAGLALADDDRTVR